MSGANDYVIVYKTLKFKSNALSRKRRERRHRRQLRERIMSLQLGGLRTHIPQLTVSFLQQRAFAVFFTD
ncbi:MAG: hypothetical protein WB696_28560 [Chthoniobacterales bacterium]